MKFECRLRIIFAEEKQKNPKFKMGDFAEKIGISKAALSALVNGKSLPSFVITYKICKELNKQLDEIWVCIDEK
ncbi:helix-turn-helix transcriptional regulator [Neobacillus sp. PS3-40]|uniref:helix-turn-helix transcriptional regulator n=1 Tax=Neobacillus sp. PS3-40 TaxID=3070679 RepID=UPI0027E0E4CC|nr:helix-turn-helix transcriptional regulator [Neobacillus sp. PS3-40]WML44096.1 helix-turn-helix transcriptional regulator [Neobacillus sp. PS3-40]